MYRKLGAMMVTLMAIAAPLNAITNSGDVDHIISTLGAWVTTLGIFSTVVVGLSAINFFAQMNQARRFGEEIKRDLLAQVDKELQALKERYGLAAIKPPDEIKNEMRAEFDS